MAVLVVQGVEGAVTASVLWGEGKTASGEGEKRPPGRDAAAGAFSQVVLAECSRRVRPFAVRGRDEGRNEEPEAQHSRWRKEEGESLYAFAASRVGEGDAVGR